MKTRNKVLAVVGSIFVIIMAFIIVNQKSQKEEGESVTVSEKSHTSDSNNETKDQKKGEEVGNDGDSNPNSASVSNDEEPSETGVGQDGNETSVGEASESEDISKTEDEDTKKEAGSLANGEVAGKTSETSKQDTQDTEAVPSTEEKSEGESGGLHFSSREEAMAFGFSRFTEEEVALYNKAAERGLTPEQEAMALQIAYSRFTAEEIAAIEEALGR
ncbi:hypothetical protein BAOM_4740 [Peribacillus asahii]|uniref:Uncharacterized protein n=1 Tax=Peribacillus asahii TaxID=228899 RepID=A0A3Q9RR33_9BACI|nr:hypothetical protein [Peribacillus asahii]AZV45318.1 hypothetical protein BAOM_4740 [Peribacillus asahii]